MFLDWIMETLPDTFALVVAVTELQDVNREPGVTGLR